MKTECDGFNKTTKVNVMILELQKTERDDFDSTNNFLDIMKKY